MAFYSFLHPQILVQAKITSFLKFSRGSMPSDPPTSLQLHCPHAPPPPEKSCLRACIRYENVIFGAIKRNTFDLELRKRKTEVGKQGVRSLYLFKITK